MSLQPIHGATSALLPDDTGGGFIGAAWTGTELFGVVAGHEPGTIAVARYDGGRDAWTVGRTVSTSWRPGATRVSTVWTGNDLVVSDGVRSVWAYDPGTDSWRALANLEPGATRSSIADVGGALVAVYNGDGRLRAARAVGDSWRVIADSPNVAIAQPVAVDSDGTIFVIDRSGLGTPMRADTSTGRWVPLDGFPLIPGASSTAVGAGAGLFVTGGLPGGTLATFTNPTPTTADAAWYTP